MQNFIKYYWLAREMGINWCWFRLIYSLKIHSGYLERKTKKFGWDQLDATNIKIITHWKPSKIKEQLKFLDKHTSRNSLLKRADEIVEGRIRLYESISVKIGEDPDWHRDPISKYNYDNKIHWSKIKDFGSSDIKNVWEPSRFLFVYDLARAYVYSGNESYPESFWQYFESWVRDNPPNSGVNWKCGQEVSLRCFAFVFATSVFAESKSTTHYRRTLMSRVLIASGQRIQSNISYALSQKGNHGLTECVGLYTLGSVLPEYKQSNHWRNTGKRLLEIEARERMYADGFGCMHSINYQRFMLDCLCWAQFMAEVNGDLFDTIVCERLVAGAEAYFQISGNDGRVPIYGSNDGSRIFPINSCEYWDFRPLIQACSVIGRGVRYFDHGSWDESNIWLSSKTDSDLMGEPVEKKSFTAKEAGLLTLRAGETFAFFHAGTYRHRPSHADQLHVDYFHDGEPVTTDAGSYSYNAKPPHDHAFKNSIFHNTVTFDGIEQMCSLSKFTWVRWSKAVGVELKLEEGWQGYLAGISLPGKNGTRYLQIRTIALHAAQGHFVVVDHLTVPDKKNCTIRWMIPHKIQALKSGEFALEIGTGKVYVSVLSNDDKANVSLVPVEWSPRYQTLKQATCIEGKQTVQTQSVWCTTFSSELSDVSIGNDHVRISFGSSESTLSITHSEINRTARQLELT